MREMREMNSTAGGGGRKEMLTVCAIVTTSIMNSKAILFNFYLE